MRRALAALVVCAGAAEVSADATDDAVRTFMAASHIPGVAVAVVQDGRIETVRGYGEANLDWSAAVTPDTAFQTASVSKLFAGVVLLRLVQRGVVRLDDPVSTYLDDAPTAWADITLGRLATHTSGLADRPEAPADASAADMVRRAAARPLAYAPGTQSRYGLTDYVVLLAALERATGLDWPALLAREVTQPLGLTHTGYSMQHDAGRVRAGRIVPQRANTYAFRDGVQHEELFLYPPHAYAAGGLFSSARDIATLFVALARGGFLDARHASLLWDAPLLDDGRRGDFGAGWTVGRYRGETATGHTGGPALADVLHLPERGLTVVVLCNQRRFYPLLAKAIADLRLPAPSLRAPIDDTRPALTAALRALLDGAVHASPDASAFEPGRGDGARAYLSDFGQALLVAVGPAQHVHVLDEHTLDEGALRRTYRIAFARRTQVWDVITDAQGRLRAVLPDAGDD
ncbi:serine hydrolase domain-containing protein [Chiayiivirga flava]|uniref:CubicO group peptidase (Beta-lactamase class C family) n=1 Tax=Chiayiivirga flava TaxID=659595 RepID=A0A7W8G0I6_9GAMM|nr:serine hydrolase domain-containing protein [Chiayiivirga flava]MBB5208359.1 CubicO group peptidase (beta-lactamase class C family) [Chiayiivirga flava]